MSWFELRSMFTFPLLSRIWNTQLLDLRDSWTFLSFWQGSDFICFRDTPSWVNTSLKIFNFYGPFSLLVLYLEMVCLVNKRGWIQLQEDTCDGFSQVERSIPCSMLNLLIHSIVISLLSILPVQYFSNIRNYPVLSHSHSQALKLIVLYCMYCNSLQI